MSGAYTPTGPWTPGGAPGISAAFLNNLEAWIALVDETAGVTVTGSSGTATLYQFLQGAVKAGFIYTSGYKNSSVQNLVLPTSFPNAAMFWVTETGGGTVEFLSGGTGRVCSAQNTISSTGGTSNATTAVSAWTNGFTRGGFDTIQLLFNGPIVTTGYIFFIGI